MFGKGFGSIYNIYNVANTSKQIVKMHEKHFLP